ncbi:hypothetical protein AAY473_019225 [Plecturocebus cupreus]
MLRDRKVVSFPRRDVADPSSKAHHPARHRGRAEDLRAVLSNTAATTHMWLFTVKLNKIQFLARTNHISGTQEPQMVSERRAGQHRCRTLPPLQNVLLDGTVPDPNGFVSGNPRLLHPPALVPLSLPPHSPPPSPESKALVLARGMSVQVLWKQQLSDRQHSAYLLSQEARDPRA